MPRICAAQREQCVFNMCLDWSPVIDALCDLHANTWQGHAAVRTALQNMAEEEV